MSDINPHSQLQQYTPRQADLVDALAESKRVVSSLVNSNPLRNAVVDDGLMRWRGNYGREYMWIGEFLPFDGVLNKPQRAVLIRRDDSVGAHVVGAWDPWGGDANPVNRPLRQILHMYDADHKDLLMESRYGGVRYPYLAVPLHPRTVSRAGFQAVTNVDFETSTVTVTNFTLPMLSAPAAVTVGAEVLQYSGMAQMIGNHIYIEGVFVRDGNRSLGVHVVLNWSDGSSYTSHRIDMDTPQWWEHHFNFEGQNKVGLDVEIEVYGSGIGGNTSQYVYNFIRRCKIYSD